MCERKLFLGTTSLHVKVDPMDGFASEVKYRALYGAK